MNLKIWRDKGIVVPDDIYSEKFRRVLLKDRFDAGITSKAWGKIFNLIRADGFALNIQDDYEVGYGPKGIAVNGDTLRGEQDVKYRRLFSEVLGVELDKDMLSGRMNMRSLMRKQMNSNDELTFGAVPNREELAAISQKLFNEGHAEYLVADALKDGYIKDGEPFTIMFKDSTVRIGGKTFSKQDEQIYNQKYRKYRNYYAGYNCYGSITKTVTYTDIINPRSDFRNGNFLFKERYKQQYEGFAKVVATMHKDGLLDTNYRHTIDYYSHEEIIVNTVPLSSTQAYKYSRMLVASDPMYYKDGLVSFFYERKSEKPFPPGKTGNAEKDELYSISSVMFLEGDLNYIVVDAVRDGLLKDGEHYDIEHKNGIVIFKGKSMTVAQQRPYNTRYNRFIKEHDKSARFAGSLEGTVKLSDILNPSSSFRMKPEVPVFVPGTSTTYSDYIIYEMHKDGLVDTAHEVRMEYSPRGIFANGVPVRGALAEKYKALFLKSDPTLRRGKKISVLWTPDKPETQNGEKKTQISEKDALQILSDRMFATGSQSFTIVDAIKDGYIKQDEPYEISYRAGKFSVKGQDIPADVRARYERKLEKFRALYGDSVNMWGTISSTLEGTVRDNEFEKQFGIMMPKPSKADKEQWVNDNEAYERNKKNGEQIKEMVRDMQKHGLLDTTQYYRVSYTKEGIFINNQHLAGLGAEKYETVLKSLGYKPGMTKNGIIRESRQSESEIPKWARSTTSFDLNPGLLRIADTMYKAGNPNFILAIALHDGVIKESRNMEFSYVDGIVSMDGKKVSEPNQTIYAAKLKSFYKQHGPHTKSHIARGQDVRIKTLYDPESRIRQAKVAELRKLLPKSTGGTSYLNEVITMMAKDGLVDTTVKHTLKYNARGIFVNGKKLTDEQAARYEPILEAGFGHKPKWISGDQVSFEHEP